MEFHIEDYPTEKNGYAFRHIYAPPPLPIPTHPRVVVDFTGSL